MTSFVSIKNKCSVCGTVTEFHVLASTNAFGSMDLDTRPPEMKRSTMRYWVQVCPNCNYVSGDIEDPLPCSADFLSSEEYARFDEIAPRSELAKTFLLKARISDMTKDDLEAFWDYLHAAWASDDAEDKHWSSKARLEALTRLAALPGDKVDNALNLIRADLLRKTRQFDILVKEYSDVSYNDDLLNSIIAFQIKKAVAEDDSTYLVSDAMSSENA